MYTADAYLLAKYDKEQTSFPRLTLKSFDSIQVYMNGPEVPCNHQEAMDLDRKNRNNNRTESETMETLQPLGYKVSKNFGLKSNAVAPRPTKMITLQFMYAVIVPICDPIALFEDNKTIIDNTPMPSQQLQKHHLMLLYYYVREALASGDYVYLFVNGKYNRSFVPCTHWGPQGAYQEPARHVSISSDRHFQRVRIRFRNGSSYSSAVSTQDGEHTERPNGHNDRGVTTKYALCPKRPNNSGIPTIIDIFMLKIE